VTAPTDTAALRRLLAEAMLLEKHKAYGASALRDEVRGK
jgi:hypothetical protein